MYAGDLWVQHGDAQVSSQDQDPGQVQGPGCPSWLGPEDEQGRKQVTYLPPVHESS